MSTHARAPRLILALAASMVCLAGCQRGMYDQPRYEPLEETDFGPFDNDRSSRHLVPGTVARGQLRIDDHLYAGKMGEKFADTFPPTLNVDQDFIVHGRERYDIFCSMCHGYDGLGNGMVVRRGFKRPPSLYEERLRTVEQGYLFDVITRGFGVMPSYAAQIPVNDRWAIVAYVRALQKTRLPAEQLTADDRAKLEEAREEAERPQPTEEAH